LSPLEKLPYEKKGPGNEGQNLKCWSESKNQLEPRGSVEGLKIKRAPRERLAQVHSSSTLKHTARNGLKEKQQQRLDEERLTVACT